MGNASIFSLSSLQKNLVDIARPYMFRASFKSSKTSLSPLGAEDDFTTATIRSANLPGLQIQEVPINFFGMTYKLSGSPTYEPIACTIIVDTNYKSRKLWFEAMTSEKGVFQYDDGQGPVWNKPETYMDTLTLYGFGTEYSQSAQYVLQMAWLSNITAINMSQETKDQPLTFDATITYSFYTTDKGAKFGGGQG